jgi:PIN domain nuclease of toxin-antitoxin system
VSAVVADTHAVVWYLTDPARLTAPALEAMREAVASGAGIFVASITLVELRYLIERGRLPEAVLDGVEAGLEGADAPLLLVPLGLEVTRALARIVREVVPDMPDRDIAATAAQLGLPLVTADYKIRASGIAVIW